VTMPMPDNQSKNTEDNWKHRSQGMRCQSCMFFVLKPIKGPAVQPGEYAHVQRLGRCRRHAPTLGGWPAMFPTDWCGDHKLDEEKA
jgi:hypothetical protein